MMIETQRQIESSHRNTVIMNFLELENSLVYFQTALKADSIMVNKISNDPHILKHNENKAYLEEIMIETEQAMQMAEVYSNILSNTLDAFASLISNNLNIVMKTLTSLTLVFNVPILIASVYGMNVEIPGSHAPHAFFFVMSLSMVLSAIAIYIFAKRRFI